MNIRRLQEIELFAGVDAAVLERIGATARELSVGEGTCLMRAGDYAYELAIVDEGEARVVVEGDEVARLGPGDVFGEGGVLRRQLRSATVEAATPMRLITLTAWDLRRLRRDCPQLVERLEQTATSRGIAAAPGG